MNNFKKVGLTALAGSLIATSAFAGSMSVSGGADISMANQSNYSSGNSFSSGDSLNFSGSGELDNGMVVTSKVEIDGGTYDDRSVVIAFPEMGTLTFQQSGSTAMSAVDDVMPTAYDASWDVLGSTTTAVAAGQTLKEGEIGGFTTNNNFFYSAPELVEGLSVNVSYTPSGTGTTGITGTARPDGSVSYALAYTGIEGLTVDYAQGDNETVGAKAEATTFKASYAYSSFTLSYSKNEYDTEAATGGQDIDSWNLAYTVNDDLSVAYGVETHDTEAQTVDEEAEYVNVSYTTGGVTLSASNYMYEGDSNTAGAGGEIDRWALSATFAF